jgi:2-polyprenyl-6-methoxyphenol hydroxylase-like FAD-dependent oxidoreductase
MSQPVLIVGAGLGGLCLAQGLRKNNIPFKLFEKDDQHDFRAQGYRLRISADGIYAVQYALSPELYTLFEQTCAETMLKGVRLNPDGTPIVGAGPLGGGGPPGMPGPKPYTVDRTTLRKVLLTGLEGHVFFGKSVDHYTIHDDKVTAHFTDGTAEDGALLVGADGLRSRVRKQHLPELKIIDTTMRVIYGKTPLTEDFLSRFPKEGHRGMSLVMDTNPEASKTLLFESMHFPYADQISQPKLPSPYLYWVLVAHRSLMLFPDDKLLSLNGEESAELSLRVTDSWNPALRSLFEMQDASQTSTLRISSALLDLPAWEPSRRVTLLGDAIHVMPPTGAMGANTALRDAADLARRIAAVGDDLTKVDEKVIGEYEAEMRAFAKKSIELSWQGGKKSFGLRPVEECDLIDI